MQPKKKRKMNDTPVQQDLLINNHKKLSEEVYNNIQHNLETLELFITNLKIRLDEYDVLPYYKKDSFFMEIVTFLFFNLGLSNEKKYKEREDDIPIYYLELFQDKNFKHKSFANHVVNIFEKNLPEHLYCLEIHYLKLSNEPKLATMSFIKSLEVSNKINYIHDNARFIKLDKLKILNFLLLSKYFHLYTKNGTDEILLELFKLNDRLVKTNSKFQDVKIYFK